MSGYIKAWLERNATADELADALERAEESAPKKAQPKGLRWVAAVDWATKEDKENL